MSCPWTSRQNKQHLVTKADHRLAELQADTGGCSLFIRQHIVLTRMWSAFVTRSMQMSFPETQHPAPPLPLPLAPTGSFSRHKLMVAVLRTEQRAAERQGEKELSRINQISPTKLFKKHTTKKTTPNHPASRGGKKIVLNRIANFLMLKN